MKSYVTQLHAITRVISDISKQDPVSICLFTTLRNLQLTFLSTNAESLKFKQFSGPLNLPMAGSTGVIINIFCPKF